MHVIPEENKEAVDGDDDPSSKPSAAYMMRRRLRNYLAWKRDFAKVSASLFAENQKSINGTSDKGSQNSRGKGPPNKRRRMRGGGAAASSTTRTANGSIRMAGDRDSHIASLLADLAPTEAEAQQKNEIAADPLDETEENFFELYEMNELVVVHPYDGDMDEHVLEEVKPRYVIMYEPDAAFIRRVEVYRSSHGDRNVRVYFMYYGNSVEEQRYLSGVRREKDAFTKLIRERG
ncbi:DNA repair protein RAD16, partial [Cryomyces antarcticus]